jgi:beta-glucanase (GH16 family)
MNPIRWHIMFVLCMAFLCRAQDSVWTLVWSDEFNNRFLDTTSWNYDTGTGVNGWGNAELQYYTKGDNIFFRDSCLVVELLRQNRGTSEYTSSRINTRKKTSFRYGKIQARIQAPYSQAVWPAVWLLGDNFDIVGWPACGEIDFFEMACGDNFTDQRGDNANFAVVHYTDLADWLAEEKKAVTINGRMSDRFHIFTVEWDNKFLSFYFDSSQTPYFQVDISKPYMTEFHQPFSLTINLALGGTGFAGYPDQTTVLPQYLTIDWVRWYQKKPAGTQMKSLPRQAGTPALEKTAGGLTFSLLDPLRSRLQVFDISGRLVADLSRWTRTLVPGKHVAAWDRLRLSRGAYLASFNGGGAGSTLFFVK